MNDPQDSPGDPDLKLEGLSMWARARQFPDSGDDWDGNWIIVHARVDAPGARVDVRGPWVRTDEVERFLKQLCAADRNLEGAAELKCLESMLSVKVTCGSLGHIQVVVEITPDPMTQCHRFEFASDQTHLAAVIKGCRAILVKYPVRGFPER